MLVTISKGFLTYISIYITSSIKTYLLRNILHHHRGSSDHDDAIVRYNKSVKFYLIQCKAM